VDDAGGSDRMTLHIELCDAARANAEAIVATMRNVTKLRGEVAVEAVGHLANDGKVIDDIRKQT
jgi:phenylacetate-CoA ligase